MSTKPKPVYAAANAAFLAVRRRGADVDAAVKKAAARFGVDADEVAAIVRRAFDLDAELTREGRPPDRRDR